MCRTIRTIPPAALMIAAALLAAPVASHAATGATIPPHYWYLEGGAFGSEKASAGIRRNSSMPMIALGYGIPLSPAMSVEFEGFLAGSSFDGPPVDNQNVFASYGSQRDLTAGGIIGWLRGSAGSGSVSPWARAGFGLSTMTLSVTGVEMLLIPSVKDETETVGTVAAAAGVDFKAGRSNALGIEVRYQMLEASFSELASGHVSAGGTMIAARFTRTLGRPGSGKP